MADSHPHPPLLLLIYNRFLENKNPARFVASVSKHYMAGSLQRLAVHPVRRIRRAAVLALGYTGDFEVHGTLGLAMQDEDPDVRLLAATACRSVWNRVGGEGQRRQLADTIRLNAAGQYRKAIETATSLLSDLPGFAEAWYQRGAAFLELDDVAQAIADFHETLERNPYHFVAATATGEAFLRLNNPVSALDAFRRALRLNPDLQWVRDQVAELARQVEDS